MATLNELASIQSNVTQATMQATKKLMDYCHTHSDSKARYCARQMQLHIHSDASYLSAPKARSRVGGHFFLSENFNPTSQTKHNGAILVVAAILKCDGLRSRGRIGGPINQRQIRRGTQNLIGRNGTPTRANDYANI